MKKQYFDDIKDVEEFVKSITCVNDVREEMVKGIIAHGYIKKSPVDEAEEMYNRLGSMSSREAVDDVVRKQHEAIQYLKKQLGEIK